MLAGHPLSAPQWARVMFAKALDRLLSKDDMVFSGLVERAEPPSWLLVISSGVLSLTATSEEVLEGSDYVVKTPLYPRSAMSNLSVIIEDTARAGQVRYQHQDGTSQLSGPDRRGSRLSPIRQSPLCVSWRLRSIYYWRAILADGLT